MLQIMFCLVISIKAEQFLNARGHRPAEVVFPVFQKRLSSYESIRYISMYSRAVATNIIIETHTHAHTIIQRANMKNTEINLRFCSISTLSISFYFYCALFASMLQHVM